MTTMQLDFARLPHICHPLLLASELIPDKRAAFCEWGGDFAARLGVPYSVTDDATLGCGVWGLVSQSVGIRLNLSDIERTARDAREFVVNSLGILLHEISHPGRGLANGRDFGLIIGRGGRLAGGASGRLRGSALLGTREKTRS